MRKKVLMMKMVDNYFIRLINCLYVSLEPICGTNRQPRKSGQAARELPVYQLSETYHILGVGRSTKFRLLCQIFVKTQVLRVNW